MMKGEQNARWRATHRPRKENEGNMKICPKCERCRDTGLIPFRNKDGKIINNAFLYCECYQDRLEHPPGLGRMKPEDFDFPVSYDFRSFVEEEATGKPLPAIKETKLLEAHSEPKWTGRQRDILNQLRAEVTGWRKKHAELLLEVDKLKVRKKDVY